MGAQQKERRRVPMRGKSCNEINESYLASRCVIRECLPYYLPPDQPKLVLDVIPGFFDRFGTGRTRPEINKALDVSQSFIAGKLFPNPRLRRTLRIRAQS